MALSIMKWLLFSALAVVSTAFVPFTHVPRSEYLTCSWSPWLSSRTNRRVASSSAVLYSSDYGDATTAYTSPQSAATIQDLLQFTNMERNRNGLRELVYNKELEKAAQRHAADMAKNDYFSHDGLNGSDLKDRVALTNYRYTNVGENLFWRTPDNDPGYAVQGWMESPGHRKNLLDEQFTEVGLGYAVDEENGKHYYVQVFGRPLQAPNVEGPGPTLDSMIRAVNDARQLQGLPPFQVSSDLSQGAQEHADDMVQKGELISKLKRGSYDRFFTQLGARFAARELFNDPNGAVQGWMKKGPQSDLLSERFTETGVGYATDGDQHYYVQLFGTPMETGVGRRDFTAPATGPAPGQYESVSGMQPPITASQAPTIVASRAGNQINMPRKKERREDRSRNGDFGKMGFGQFNEARREDSDDEVDNTWNDDKRVIAQMRERRGRTRMSRTNNPQRADQSGIDRRAPNAEHSHEEWDDDRRVMDQMRQNRGGPMFPNQSKYFGNNPMQETKKNNPNAVGFDDSWDKDYAGTANQLKRIPQGGRSRNGMRRPGYGGMPPGGPDDYYYDDWDDGYYDDRRMPARGRRRERFYDYDDGRDMRPRGGRRQDAYDDRRNGVSQQQRNNNGMRSSGGPGDQRNGTKRGPRRRTNTPGVFGQPNKRSKGGDGNISNLHFQRHEEQEFDSRMRGMNRDDYYDDDYYGERGGGRYGGRRGGEYYGGGRRGPPPPGWDDYNYNMRNRRRGMPPDYY